MFLIRRNYIFEILTILTDPGVVWGPSWRSAQPAARRHAERLASDARRFGAVGAILAEPSVFPGIADSLRELAPELDSLSGPRSLVLTPTPPPPSLQRELELKPHFDAYQELVRIDRSQRSHHESREDTGEGRRFESSFRAALGLHDSVGPGIVAAPTFNSSAFVWVPIDPRVPDQAFRAVRDIAEDGGLQRFSDRIRLVPTGESIGTALRGVVAAGTTRDGRGPSEERDFGQPIQRSELIHAAKSAIEAAELAIDRLRRAQHGMPDGEGEEQIFRLTEHVASLRAQMGAPKRRSAKVRELVVDRAGLCPLALASIEQAEFLLRRPAATDHSLAVVGVARCLEIEVNHSLLQWRRHVRGIPMPACFMRHSPPHGVVLDGPPEQPDRAFDINRPRNHAEPELMAPALGRLLSIGGALVRPAPRVGHPDCDDADWARIQAACSQITEHRNAAAHDRRIDDETMEHVLQRLEDLDSARAWRAFATLRDHLR